MSLRPARSHAALTNGDARLLRLLHESGALPELFWRDGCREDTEELVLCMSFYTSPPTDMYAQANTSDLDRHHQSTTRASHLYFPRLAPYLDLRTCISPTVSTQSLHTVPPGVWTSSLRWATSSPSPCGGANECRSRTQSSTFSVSCCLTIGLRAITSCLR